MVAVVVVLMVVVLLLMMLVVIPVDGGLIFWWILVAQVVVTIIVWPNLGYLDETPEREFWTQKDASLFVETADGDLFEVADVEEAGWEAVLVDPVVRRMETRSGWDVFWIDALKFLSIVDVDRKWPATTEVVKDNLQQQQEGIDPANTMKNKQSLIQYAEMNERLLDWSVLNCSDTIWTVLKWMELFWNDLNFSCLILTVLILSKLFWYYLNSF